MAILQLSRVTHRKGFIEDLPQLAGAELGWALDSRRLFIGNGKVEDGAPIVGNTELLTQYSDIIGLTSTYTYKGYHGGYKVRTSGGSDDITRSLQAKFDEYVSVLDFGAVGDGETDDTGAINRALYELFCISTNTKMRRVLHLPAGVYKVTDTIKIPPYTKIYGDGLDSTIIKYYSPDNGTTIANHVVVTSDSLHETGVSLGQNGATMPTDVEMFDMTFTSNEKNSIFLVDSLTNSKFDNVRFGNDVVIPLNVTNACIDFDYDTDCIEGASRFTSAIEIVSNNNTISANILFNKCSLHGATYGLNINDQCNGLQFMNGELSTLFQGVNLGAIVVNGVNPIDPTNGPTGISISQNIFDLISNTGITIGDVEMNSTSSNIFYNVGNSFTTRPASPIIDIYNANNISFGDLFERNDTAALKDPRISLNGQAAIAFDSSHAMLLGSYERKTGMIADIPDDDVFGDTELFTLNSYELGKFKVDYTMTFTDSNAPDPILGIRPLPSQQIARIGTFTVTNALINDITDSQIGVEYGDDFSETKPLWFNLTARADLSVQPGNIPGTKVYISKSLVDYHPTGRNISIKYSIVRMD